MEGRVPVAAQSHNSTVSFVVVVVVVPPLIVAMDSLHSSHDTFQLATNPAADSTPMPSRKRKHTTAPVGKSGWFGGKKADLRELHSTYGVQVEPAMTFYCVLCKASNLEGVRHFEVKASGERGCTYDCCLRVAKGFQQMYCRDMQAWGRDKSGPEPVLRVMTTTAWIAMQVKFASFNPSRIREQPEGWLPDEALCMQGNAVDIDGEIIDHGDVPSTAQMYDSLKPAAKLDFSNYFIDNPEHFADNLTDDPFYYSQFKFEQRRESQVSTDAHSNVIASLRAEVEALKTERTVYLGALSNLTDSFNRLISKLLADQDVLAAPGAEDLLELSKQQLASSLELLSHAKTGSLKS